MRISLKKVGSYQFAVKAFKENLCLLDNGHLSEVVGCLPKHNQKQHEYFIGMQLFFQNK